MGYSIDAGGGAGTSFSASSRTSVDKTNPANLSGMIYQITVKTSLINLANSIKVASFIDEGSNVLSTREYAAITHAQLAAGTHTFTAPDDFVPFGIASGDYIGAYISGIYFTSSGGSGMWYKDGDNIPCSSAEFTFSANYVQHIYAEGYEVGQINIGDSWKSIIGININIGDTWKPYIEGKINISDVWKDINH